MPRKAKPKPETPPQPVTLRSDRSVTNGFAVTYESNVEDGPKSGDRVRGVSFYTSLWELTGPFEEVDGAFVETGFRHLPTHAGKLTQRRTLHLPAGITESSRARIRRYMLRPSKIVVKEPEAACVETEAVPSSSG